MRAVAALVVLCAGGCGRVGFDAPGDGGGDRDSDGARPDATDPAPGNLVLHYAFDDDPTDGIAHDGSATGVSTSCASTCPTVGQGVIGAGYHFNGSSDVLVISDTPALHLTAATLAIWVRAEELPATGSFMFMFGKPHGSAGADSFELALAGGGATSVTAGGDSVSGPYITVPWTAGIGTWVHVAFTWDGTTTVLYADGVQLGTETQFPIVYDASQLLLGADQDSGLSYFWSGDFDDARIYNRALSAAEISALAQ